MSNIIRKKYIIVLLMFLVYAVYCNYLNYKIAYNLYNNNVSEYIAFYWLQNKFILIQSANNMVTYGGCIAVILGCIVDDKNYKKNIIVTIILGYLVFILIGLIFGLIKNPSLITKESFSIIEKSIKIVLAIVLYLLFWSFLSYRIKQKSNAIITILALCGEQLFEVYQIFLKNPSKLSVFLPTAVSRELVVKQFPFWIRGSWVYNINTFCYSNSTILIDGNSNYIDLRYWQIILILLTYMVLVNISNLYEQIRKGVWGYVKTSNGKRLYKEYKRSPGVGK